MQDTAPKTHAPIICQHAHQADPPMMSAGLERWTEAAVPSSRRIGGAFSPSPAGWALEGVLVGIRTKLSRWWSHLIGWPPPSGAMPTCVIVIVVVCYDASQVAGCLWLWPVAMADLVLAGFHPQAQVVVSLRSRSITAHGQCLFMVRHVRSRRCAREDCGMPDAGLPDAGLPLPFHRLPPPPSP